MHELKVHQLTGIAGGAKSKTKLVITDVDGTLASFWDYFVPAIRDFFKRHQPENRQVLSRAGSRYRARH